MQFQEMDQALYMVGCKIWTNHRADIIRALDKGSFYVHINKKTQTTVHTVLCL